VIAGPNLPKATAGAAMVPTPDGTGVVLIGGYNSRKEPKDLIELKCSSSSYNLGYMKQKLSVDQAYSVAINV
jgi:hypothetical protein